MYLKVKVTSDAKRDELKQVSPDHFLVSVTAPAKHNLANRQVARLLALAFNLPASRVRLVSGHHSPSKIFDLMLE